MPSVTERLVVSSPSACEVWAHRLLQQFSEAASHKPVFGEHPLALAVVGLADGGHTAPGVAGISSQLRDRDCSQPPEKFLRAIRGMRFAS
jgi:hypothetical protein